VFEKKKKKMITSLFLTHTKLVFMQLLWPHLQNQLAN
jgi:hypothetical protein